MRSIAGISVGQLWAMATRTERRREKILLAALVVALIAGMEILMRCNVTQIPERGLGERVVRNDTTVAERFGQPFEVKYSGGRTSWTGSSGSREGTQNFVVTGTKATGWVYVDWTSEGNGKDFRVNSVRIQVANAFERMFLR